MDFGRCGRVLAWVVEAGERKDVAKGFEVEGYRSSSGCRVLVGVAFALERVD